jgi:hypothetical protein
MLKGDLLRLERNRTRDLQISEKSITLIIHDNVLYHGYNPKDIGCCQRLTPGVMAQPHKTAES